MPISRNFGFDRGLPIDRYYIERFLDRYKGDIHGRVLEIGDDEYSRRFGAERVSKQDILHVNPGNPSATIVGDLTDEKLLDPNGFDCIVLTQTLHLVYDMRCAIKNIHNALKPGGTLLLTVPAICPSIAMNGGSSWYWSLTRLAAERLIGDFFGANNTHAEGHGNVFSATAFLQGLALEEVPVAKLDVSDAAYPVIVAVRAQKGMN